MKIDINSGIPIYLQIVTEVKNAALFGRYRHGDRIPPVRELALALRINPNTVAKAYRILQDEGWLESRPGGGNFIIFQEEMEVESRREDTIRQDLAAIWQKAKTLGIGKDRLTAMLGEIIQGDKKHDGN